MLHSVLQGKVSVEYDPWAFTAPDLVSRTLMLSCAERVIDGSTLFYEAFGCTFIPNIPRTC